VAPTTDVSSANYFRPICFDPPTLGPTGVDESMFLSASPLYLREGDRGDAPGGDLNSNELHLVSVFNISASKTMAENCIMCLVPPVLKIYIKKHWNVELQMSG